MAIKGFEAMRALRKGQASAFNVTGDVRGEARIVERAPGWLRLLRPKWSNCLDAGSNSRWPYQASRRVVLLPLHRKFGTVRQLRGTAVSLQLRVSGLLNPLPFISTETVFETPVNVTLPQLALECFYPAYDATRAMLMRQAVRDPT